MYAPPESDEGCIEYKLKIVDIERLQRRMTQILYKINEGEGTGYLYLGVHDQGYVEGISDEEWTISMSHLQFICQSLDVSCHCLCEFSCVNNKKAACFQFKKTNF